MNWKIFFKHYLSSTGRSGRVECITVFLLPYLLICLLLSILTIVPIFGFLLLIIFLPVSLALVWASWMVLARRFHDFNISAWYVAVYWIFSLSLSLCGFKWLSLGLHLFVESACFFIPGNTKNNEFGPVPDLLGGLLPEEQKTETPSDTTSGRIDFKL